VGACTLSLAGHRKFACSALNSAAARRMDSSEFARARAPLPRLVLQVKPTYCPTAYKGTRYSTGSAVVSTLVRFPRPASLESVNRHRLAAAGTFDLEGQPIVVASMIVERGKNRLPASTKKLAVH